MSMTPIGTALERLDQLYQSIEDHLEREYTNLQAGLLDGESLLAEGADLAREMSLADLEVARLAELWQSCPVRGAEGDRGGIALQASRLQERARSLVHLVQRNEAALRRLHEAARSSLEEVRVGAQYLQSMRYLQGSRPRYIDARR
ncbi:MAG: hypothetical protein ABIG68_00465 [Acidobacteriota bacterium]